MRFYDLRVKLARWLAPELEFELDHFKGQLEYHQQRGRQAVYWEAVAQRRSRALFDVASLETPKCASIGRRMAAIAREGLR